MGMSKYNRDLTYKLAKYLFEYDSETGKVFWKNVRSFRLKIGQEAGSKKPDGYIIISVNRCMYKAHQIVWLLHNKRLPIYEIDHIDGNPSNNRLENLRDVPRNVNHKNQSLRSTNTSGYNGVSWSKHRQKWVARITVNNKVMPLGRFKTIEEAIEIRKRADEKFGFHPNHGRSK